MARSRSPKSPAATFWLGIAFLLIGALLAYLLVSFWPRTIEIKAGPPAVTAAAGGGQAAAVKKAWNEETNFFGFTFKLDADVRLLILVLLSGALGSYVHAAQSFASYVGNARFRPSWTWWYVLRMPMGAALAVFVYFCVRGGLLAAGTATGSGAANELNLFGIMAFSGLAGLFSKQAADKLAQLVLALAVLLGGEQREDKLGENPRPEV